MWERSPTVRLIWGVALGGLLLYLGGSALSSGKPVTGPRSSVHPRWEFVVGVGLQRSRLAQRGGGRVAVA